MKNKIFLELEDFDLIMSKLKQAESIANLMSCSSDIQLDEANVFWAIKELVESAKNTVNKRESV